MPKKKKAESQKEQSKRFLDKVQVLEDAGELNPTEGEEKFELGLEAIVRHREKPDPQ